MIIAQISDTHVALDSDDAERRLADFERTIEAINALDPQPDVIVHTGDIVHNGRKDEYEASAAILAKARAPVFVLAGNKDHRENLHAAFFDAGYLAPSPEFIDYTVEDHPVRLIAVDTVSTTSKKGDFCPARAERLTRMIDQDPDRPVAVFTHHPPFEVPVGPDSLNFVEEEMMERLRRVLLASGRVMSVFSGHVHRATNGSVGDIPATVMPCIATTLRWGSYPEYMKRLPVYYLHRLDKDAGFVTEVRVVAMDGAKEAMPLAL